MPGAKQNHLKILTKAWAPAPAHTERVVWTSEHLLEGGFAENESLLNFLNDNNDELEEKALK